MLLDKAIRAAPNDEKTWGWFYTVCENDKERVKCLGEILRINPNHQQARKLYDDLTGVPMPTLEAPPPPAPYQPASAQSTPTKPPKKKSAVPYLLSAIIIICIIGYAATNCGGKKASPSTNSLPATLISAPKSTPTSAIAWVPSGFTRWDDNIAIRFVAGENCSYSTVEACAHYEVFAHYGCPDSLYVEVAFLDSNGSQVDWSNDTASRLISGEKALLEFISFDKSAIKVKVTKIDCY